MKDKLYRVDEFCKDHGIGRATFYNEVAAGRLKVLKCGRRTLVSEAAGELWWNRRYKLKKYKPRKVLQRRRKICFFGDCFKLFFRKWK